MALIFKSDSWSNADFKACEVHSRHVADLLVFLEKSRGPAQGADGVWCIVDSAGSSTSKVNWVMSRNDADLLIYFVTSRSASGWRREHPLKGKL